MKNKTSHTPTPWEINRDHAKEPRMVKINPVDCHIGLAAVFGETDEEADANAAFIIRACNSHEELLETIKELYANWREYTDLPDDWHELNEKVEKAIAKAEGK